MRERAVRTARAAWRVDRLMVISLVAVGAMWLLLLAPPWRTDGAQGLVSFTILVAYVVGGGVAMGVLYARDEVTVQQELLTLAALWLVAFGLWTAAFLRLGVLAEHSTDTAYLVNGVSWPDSIATGLWLATLCFIAWQVPALLLRIAWRRLARAAGVSGS